MKNAIKFGTGALLCAAVIAVSGCAQGNSPAQTTTVEQTMTAAEQTAAAAEQTTTTVEQTTTAAETTTAGQTAAASESTGEQEKYPFRTGVWIARGERGSADYDETYYCFREDGSGSTMSQSMGIGVGFGYEREDGSPERFRFEMGGVGSYSYMELVDGAPEDDRFMVQWDGSDTTEEWEYLSSADEFSFYDNYSLGLMSKFLYGMGQYSIADPTVETAFEFDKISVILRDPAEESDARSIVAWYFLDRYTATGNDSDGNPIDLAMFDGEWAEMPYPNTFGSMPAIKELGTLRENGEMLGFWYIGYVEPDLDNFDNFRDLYLRMFEITDMDRKVRYLRSFPSDSFVTSGGGQELYLLLPSDVHGSITISELVYDETTGEAKEGDVLYSRDDDLRPVLLKCNRSEIMPDVIVRLTDSSGELLEWSPCISGKDGSVVTENNTRKAIRDFTDHNRLMHPDLMPETVG